MPRSHKAVGIALLGFGTLISLLGLSGGRSSYSVGGPVLVFFGIVMIAQARKRSE